MGSQLRYIVKLRPRTPCPNPVQARMRNLLKLRRKFSGKEKRPASVLKAVSANPADSKPQSLQPRTPNDP